MSSSSQHSIVLITYQYGVPTKELAGDAMEAEPKSASLTWPGSVSRTFPAFTSLKTKKELITKESKHIFFGLVSLYILYLLPMDHVVGVKVGQTLQSTMCDGSYLNLLQRFFVNCVSEESLAEKSASGRTKINVCFVFL